jgi:hypothetical protein
MKSASHPIAGVDYPRTFQELDQWFRDDAACRAYIRRLRWPEGFVCPHCGVSGEPWTMSDKLLRCRSCHGRTSLTAGTLFDGTRKPLRTWFMAMWFVTSQKNGVRCDKAHSGKYGRCRDLRRPLAESQEQSGSLNVLQRSPPARDATCSRYKASCGPLAST